MKLKCLQICLTVAKRWQHHPPPSKKLKVSSLRWHTVKCLSVWQAEFSQQHHIIRDWNLYFKLLHECHCTSLTDIWTVSSTPRHDVKALQNRGRPSAMTAASVRFLLLLPGPRSRSSHHQTCAIAAASDKHTESLFTSQSVAYPEALPGPWRITILTLWWQNSSRGLSGQRGGTGLHLS